MSDEVEILAQRVRDCYHELILVDKKGSSLVKCAETILGPLLRDIGDHSASVVYSWDVEVLEEYFELLAISVLFTDVARSQLTQLESIVNQLRALLQSSCPTTAASSAVRAVVESLILLMEGVADETAREILELLASLAEAPVGVTGRQSNSRFEPLPKADRAGLRELLQIGLYREVDAFLRQRAKIADATGDHHPITKHPITKSSLPVVSLMSRKGGVGKTILAMSIALWYAENHPSAKVCILDLDFSGPVWQYLLFPERNRPANFLNDIIEVGQPNQAGEFSFPTAITVEAVEKLLEKASIAGVDADLRLLTIADLPRTSRYLSLAISNNNKSCFNFLCELVKTLESLVDVLIIDNEPGFGDLPLLSHILSSSVQYGVSIAVSTPALADLRGTIIELSDVGVLSRDSYLIQRPPIWVVNKANEEAQAFLSKEQDLLAVANEIDAYSRIMPDRPIAARCLAAVKSPFQGVPLPLDQSLLAFGCLKASEDRLKELPDFLHSDFYEAFCSSLAPLLSDCLTNSANSSSIERA